MIPSVIDDFSLVFCGSRRTSTPSQSDLCVVTAFFDIGRGDWSRQTSEVSDKYRRTVDTYFENFRHLAALPNDLVVFTSTDLAPRVIALRQEMGLDDRTVVFVVDDLFAVPSVRAILPVVQSQLTDGFRDFVWRPTAPEYNKADYVIVNALKSSFAVTAIARGVVNQRQIAWIDFGYASEPRMIDNGAEWRFDFGDKINLFAIFEPDDRPVYDIVRRGEVYFQGCHIVGPADAWWRFNTEMGDALRALVACNLMDDDQTMLLMAYRAAPENFTLRRRRIDPDLGWRFIINRFREGLDPRDEELEPVRDPGHPAWYRDFKTYVRRRLRRTAERYLKR